MNTERFGDAYYADGAPHPAWHGADDALARRIKPFLDALDLEARHDVEQTVRVSRTGLHARLRALTQLGRGDATGMSVRVVVSDRIPPNVLHRLAALPDAMLWALLNRPQITATRQGIDLMLGEHDRLTGLSGLPGLGGARPALEGSGSFLRALESASRQADDEIKAILRMTQDALGSYHFVHGRIELYWIMIWIVANELRVSVDDLAMVVLTHELAHLYTHIGQDADGHEWDTDDFARTQNPIVEGLAQFYTQQVLTVIADAGNPRPLSAFERLLKQQAPAYTCFGSWLPSHGKRVECIRNALVRTRAHHVHEYQDFERLLDSSGQAL